MLKGKTALVTGSTSGIGLGIAKELASKGINIAMNGFGDEAEIKTMQDEIANTYGVDVIYHGADMTKPEQIREMCSHAVHHFGGVDILINNAGIQFVGPIETYPEEHWDAIIAINLSAVFHATKAIIPSMKDRGWGRIVNISSAHGIVASPYKGAYIASKHGVIGFTKTTALEVAADNITANTICPGYVLTPLVEGQIADQAISHGLSESEVVDQVMLKTQPTKKFVQIEEVAKLAGFLCEEAAQGITGSNYSIDGGWTAH